MWRTVLQDAPDSIADSVLLTTQSRIPKAKHLHSSGLQPRITHLIILPLFWMTVLAPIEFDIQESLDTKEVEDVRSKRVLPTKLVGREAALSKPPPNQLLGPRVILAEHACNTS